MTFPYDRARLDGLVADVEARMAAVERTAREASRVQLRSRGLTQADFAEISRFANSPGAPRELKELARRVDAGEMSWEDVASGRAVDDEGVQRALQAGVPDLQRAYTAIQEGDDPEDVVSAGSPRPGGRGDDDDEPGRFTEDAW
ncbi:hypothetical protein [Saccharothrix longispora]|uniref:hypothetical protein n=1 Tax=Saccharothrix longispora TaxID=33920 RepID=UPI0028FD6243|nr:hypothetical protein [Saccharothrix longispora]MBY8848004.1 hypothetical protein [Saccharothrix sp. MB29]MDU0289238.1 hypothetical protein [Saccharothrix longispora]